MNPTGAISGSYEPVTGREVTESANRLANQDVFMQLLVAQLRHQNPMNPADGIAFMTQLTQFSQLEQAISSRKELETIRKLLEQEHAAVEPVPAP